MRVLDRVVAVSAAILASSFAAAADLRPRLIVSFGSEVGRPGEAVAIDVAYLDPSGAPLEAQVAIDVDAGKATPPQRIAAGVYRSTVIIPTKLPTSRSLLVLARTNVSNVEAALRLGAAPAATLHVDGPAVCRGDAEACRIDVTAADSYGNPAVEVPDASAELGRVSPAGTADPGHWVIIYHPPRLDRERADRVTIELGALQAVHPMKLLPATGAIGFVPLLGGVRQKGHNGFSAGGQVIGMRNLGSGWLAGAGVEGSWWSVSRSGESLGLHVSTDRSQLALGLFVQAERPFSGGVVTALSLGGGAVRVSSTAHVEDQPGVSDSGWAPTARATASLGYRLGFGTPFIEGRVAWVGDAHLVTDPGAQWPLFLELGYRLDVR